MPPLDEDLIATYARHPEDLAPAERMRIERLIADDAAAARLYEFYSALAEIEDTPHEAIPGLEALLRELAPLPRMIPLSPAAPPFDPPLPPPMITERRESGNPIVLTPSWEHDRANLAVRIYRAGNDFRVYAKTGSVTGSISSTGSSIGSSGISEDIQPTAHALLVVPEIDARVKLDGAGRGTVTAAFAQHAELFRIAQLFRTAELYPPQHYETIPFEALLDVPHHLVPDFSLRIDVRSQEKWIPSLHTDFTTFRYVAVEWPIEPVVEGTSRGSTSPNQHVIKRAGKWASVSIDHDPVSVRIAIYG